MTADFARCRHDVSVRRSGTAVGLALAAALLASAPPSTAQPAQERPALAARASSAQAWLAHGRSSAQGWSSARGWPVRGRLVLAQPAPTEEAGVAPEAPLPDPRPDDAFADPAVAGLQRKAAEAQAELTGLQDRVRRAQEELDGARAALDGATRKRAAADEAVAALRSEMDSLTAAAFADLGRPSALRLLLTVDDADDLLDGAELLDVVRVDVDRRMVAALSARRDAVAAERAAAQAEQQAAARHAAVDGAASGASGRARAIADEMGTALAAVNRAVVAVQQTQHDRNVRTAANWRGYLDRLRAAGVRAPAAVALRDPSRLPAGLRSLPGSAGDQPGAARSGDLLVLPAEVITAVTAAVDALERPYTPGRGGEGPDAYDCGGLVRTVFGAAGIGLPGTPEEQMATTTPVPVADVQPGDLVFFGPTAAGVQHVGIALDGHTMIAADARLSTVAVTDVPAADLLGAARPTLGGRPAAAVPAASDPLRRRCNGVVVPPGARAASGAWGGYPNGLIPAAALCSLGGGNALRCDAALAYRALSAAFAAAFRQPLCLGNSYRTYDAQVQLYAAKPALAAVPGTSNHGWGLAVDLCGGASSFGTPEYAWLSANAPAFGWVNPPWAAPGHGREEPWHWEYTG